MHIPRDVRLLVVLSLLAACGCDGASAPKSPPDSEPKAAGSDSSSETPHHADAAQPADGPAKGASLPGASGSAPRKPPTPSPEQIAKWDVPEFTPMQLLACDDNFTGMGIQCMAVTPDGKQFVLGGLALMLWDRQNQQVSVDLLEKHKPDEKHPIRSVAISPDGKWLAAGDEKGTVRIWTLGDQQEVAAIKAHQGHITQLAFSPGSRLLATTSYSGDVILWELPEGKKLKSLKMDKHEIRELCFVSESQLASAGSDSSLWNVETGAKEKALTSDRVIGPALGLSSDRRLLAFSDADSAVQFWDVQNSQTTGVPLRGGGAHQIAFSQDGKWIATQSGYSEIRIWDAAAGRVVQVIDADGGRTSALAWLPDGAALLVASERGRLRLWGTAETTAAIGLEPLPLPALAAPAEGAHRSLSSARLQKVIDVRSFPRLPGAVPGYCELGMCSYTAPVSQDEAELFYRYSLGKAGWTEAAPSAGPPGLTFRKDGCELNVSMSRAAAAGAAGEGNLQVSLYFEGNYDVRWLPRLAEVDANKNTFATFSHVSYRTKADLTDVEAALLKQFHEAGWTGYTRLGASSAEETDTRTISMLQGGSVLTLSIGPPADAPDELIVQTSIMVSNKSLPIPPDAGWIEFDSSTDLQAVINTKMDLEQTVAYFDEQMAAEGWLAREAGRYVKDDKAWLPYVRGQQDVDLRLAAIPAGGTRVVVGQAASSSWQLQMPVVEKTDKPGVEAADFQLPKGATAVKFVVDAKRIDFEVPEMTPPKLGELFAEQMESLEWKRERAGIVSDEYTFITYSKDKSEIQLRARPKGKNSSAIISGNGLFWTKPLPTAPVRISYETWLRRGRKNATLDLLDEFVAEMHKIPARRSGAGR